VVSIYFCVAGKRERLVICKDDIRKDFDNMSEVPDGLIHGQDPTVVRTLILRGLTKGSRKPGVAKRCRHVAGRRRQ
jgi:hypothetical protein